MEAVHLPYAAEGCDLPMENVVQYSAFLEEVSHAIEKRMIDGMMIGCLTIYMIIYIRFIFTISFLN